MIIYLCVSYNNIYSISFFNFRIRENTIINKKIIAFTAAISLIPSSFNNSASASANYTISDLRHLRDALLRASDITAADDINGDGIVNVVDLCL